MAFRNFFDDKKKSIPVIQNSETGLRSLQNIKDAVPVIDTAIPPVATQAVPAIQAVAQQSPAVATTQPPPVVATTPPVAPTQTTPAEPKKRTKLEGLSRPEKPVKADFLDTDRIDKSKEQAQHIAKANAMIAVMTALMDATQLNKEGYQNISPFVANQSAFIPQFMQNLRTEEQNGMRAYQNALTNWRNQDANIANQEVITNYNRENQIADRDEARTNQIADREELRTYNETQDVQRFKQNLVNTMINRGYELEDINTYLKEMNLTPLTSLPEKTTVNGTRTSNSSRVSKEAYELAKSMKTPEAQAGLDLILEGIANDDASAMSGMSISKDATILEKYKKDPEILELYAEKRFNQELNAIVSEAEQLASANNVEGLKLNADKLAKLLRRTGASPEEIAQVIQQTYPDLMPPQSQTVIPQNPDSTKSKPIQPSKADTSVNVQKTAKPKRMMQDESGKLVEMDEATAQKADALRKELDSVDKQLDTLQAQINKTTDKGEKERLEQTKTQLKKKRLVTFTKYKELATSKKS